MRRMLVTFGIAIGCGACGGSDFVAGEPAPVVDTQDAATDAGVDAGTAPPDCILFSVEGQTNLMVKCALGQPPTMYTCRAAPPESLKCDQPSAIQHPSLWCCP